MMPPAETNDTRQALYKVLIGGASAHGGAMTWSLPTQGDDGTWTPGAWHEVDGPLVLCENGLHLTPTPADWYLDDSTLYAAEFDGDIVDNGSNKVCVRRARLVSVAPWSDHGIYHEGEHVVTEGRVRASDSATVEASGSATVISTPWHSDSAQVALSHMAAHVDRRGDNLVLRSAEQAGAQS